MKAFLLYFIGTSIALSACHGDEQKNNPPPPEPTRAEVKEGLIKSHQMLVRQEEDEIAQYIKQHNYYMQALSTGVHYMIYEHGKGIQPIVGDYATVSYKISLLDGTLCYDSKAKGPKNFKVGEDAIESGVHQAVQLMHSGDKGIFIIPSYLAQGLVGDKDKIPPGAPVVYDMSLISVKHVVPK